MINTFHHHFSACTSGPPSNTGVMFTPVDLTYIPGEIVTYFCISGTLSPSPATNECVNGSWTRPSPLCFSEILDLKLLYCICDNNIFIIKLFALFVRDLGLWGSITVAIKLDTASPKACHRCDANGSPLL